jgi:TonB family protein
MNAALLYLPRRRWTFWIALACAAAIHVGAIVLAKAKSEKIAPEHFTQPAVDINMVDTAPEPVPPEESALPPPPEQFSPGEDAFPEETRTPRPVHPRTKTRAASFVKGTAARLGTVKASLLYAPRPVYPYEARRQKITGSGVALLTVDPTVGNVTNVRMTQSCGNGILDNATLDAFRRWRFRRGNLSSVEVPITYTLRGASY